MPHESSGGEEKKRYDGGYGPVERQRTQAMYDAPEDAGAGARGRKHTWSIIPRLDRNHTSFSHASQKR